MADSQETFALFTSLLAGIGGLIVLLIIVVLAFTNFQSTANTLVLLSNNGVAKVRQIAGTLIAQAVTVVQSVVPEVEQVASNVGTAVVSGVQLLFNAIVAIGSSMIETVIETFKNIAEVIRDLGQGLIQIFVDFFTPFMQYIQVQIDTIGSSIDIVVYLFESLSNVAVHFVEAFQGLNWPSV